MLINKFGPLFGHKYKEQLRSTEFSMFDSAEQVCELLVKQTFYLEMYLEVCSLAKIHLTIPLSTTRPERGFSILARIKTKIRHRLLHSTLAALLSVSLNQGLLHDI